MLLIFLIVFTLFCIHKPNGEFTKFKSAAYVSITCTFLVAFFAPGFAHGFYVLSDWSEVLYKTTDYYAPKREPTLLWNDPTVNVNWPLINGQNPIISKKDAQGCNFEEIELFE
jgi:dTDP-4-dehydrorhamnose 3,5-epimerase-like enzyme